MGKVRSFLLAQVKFIKNLLLVAIASYEQIYLTLLVIVLLPIKIAQYVLKHAIRWVFSVLQKFIGGNLIIFMKLWVFYWERMGNICITFFILIFNKVFANAQDHILWAIKDLYDIILRLTFFFQETYEVMFQQKDINLIVVEIYRNVQAFRFLKSNFLRNIAFNHFLFFVNLLLFIHRKVMIFLYDLSLKVIRINKLNFATVFNIVVLCESIIE